MELTNLIQVDVFEFYEKVIADRKAGRRKAAND